MMAKQREPGNALINKLTKTRIKSHISSREIEEDELDIKLTRFQWNFLWNFIGYL